MGLMDDLFGGSEMKSNLTAGQANLLNFLSDNVLSDLKKGPNLYQGQTLADVTPNMTNALAGYQGAAQANPNIDIALNSALSGVGDPASLMTAFNAQLGPAREEFNRTLEAVGNKYGTTWGRTGAMPEMVGRATADYGNDVTSMLGQMVFGHNQAALDRQLQAVPIANATRDSNMAALAGLFQAGATERGLTQDYLTEDFNKFNAGQWYNNPALSLVGPILGTQAKVATQKPGIMQGTGALLGGIGSFFG